MIHRDEGMAECLASKQPLGEYRSDSLAAEEILTLANWCLLHFAQEADPAGVRYESTRQLVTHPAGQFAFKRPLPALSPHGASAFSAAFGCFWMILARMFIPSSTPLAAHSCATQ